jgi:hypothetical protein
MVELNKLQIEQKIIVAFRVISANGRIKLNSENQEYGRSTRTPPNSVYDYKKALKQLFKSQNLRKELF